MYFNDLRFYKPSLTLMVFFMTLGVSAQVVLTSALAPPVGTKLFFRELNSPAAFNYQRSGENLIWDFSTYPLSIPDSVMYIDPSSTGYQSIFPAAQLAVQLGENETGFIQYSTSDYALQGLVADVGFGPLAMPLTPPLPLFTFPYTYGSSINSTSKTLIKNTGAAFGIAADSVKYLVTMNTARLVRGWGNLILPHASYPGTLLERAITTQTDSMWMKIPFFGWISVPGYPTTTIDSTYNWITGDLLHPYAESGFDDAGQPYYVSILSDPSTSITEITPKLKSLVFPNPANNEIHVKLSNTISVDQIILYDINGNKMNVWSSVPKSVSFTASISHLMPGIYFLQIEQKGLPVERLQFIKR